MQAFQLTSLAAILLPAAAVLSGQSTDLDKKIGAEAAEQVITTKGLYEAPDLQKFYEKLGARLVSGLGEQPFTYRFAITDEIEPNAYALPAGFVFATRNIFTVASSEDELAGVIGHEIIHSHKRHSVKAAKRSILPAIFGVPGQLAGIFNEEAGKVLGAPSNLALAHHSRKNETEADELGVRLAAASGYDPLALEKCLNRLSRTIELFTGEAEKSSYFDGHPATRDRDKHIEKIAASAERGKTAPLLPNREAYVRLLDGMVLGKNPEQGIFEKSAFLHPEMNFRMDLPEGWKTFNAPVAFGAIEQKGKGQIVVGLVEGARDPEAAARETVERIAKKARKEPAEARAVVVNGHPGYYALYSEKKSNLYLLWVSMGGKMFRIAGAGEEKFKAALREAALSLRPMTAAERGSVRVLRLRIVAARAGETLEAFCQRTESAFKPELTAVLNDVESRTLSPGELLKVARWEPYSGVTK